MLEHDYFEAKRQELGLERQDVLVAIQRTLESWFPGQARARQLHNGVLRVVTPSSSVASELRLRQVALFEAHDLHDTRLSVVVGSL